MMKAVLSAAAVLLTMSGTASAQKYPSRNIEIIIPFAAGGGVDLIGRSVAASLAEQLGQAVVVQNRDGAGGTIGFGALAAAAPDGYTLGFGPSTPIANAPYLVKNVRYSPESFDYICQVFENPFSIAVGPNSPYKTAQDLLAAAKDKSLNFGHAGLGSIPHLSVENFADAMKIKVQHLPFRGDAAMLPVLIKGDLDFGAPALSSIRGNDQIRPLVVFSDKRSPSHPDVPTAGELGVKTSVPPGQNGLYAPKGLPAEVKAALEKGCATAVKSDGVLKVVGNTGSSVAYMDGKQFHDQTVADYKFKGELIKRLGLGAN
ncbi:MAG: Bug family tripartite tricarboxylate transporter substrate binding protein [Pseudorhodoplanes sp.]